MRKKVTITVTEEMLEMVDVTSEKIGLTRSAFVTMVMAEHFRQAEVLATFRNGSAVMDELKKMQDYVMRGKIPEE